MIAALASQSLRSGQPAAPAPAHKARSIDNFTELADVAGTEDPTQLAYELVMLSEGAITMRHALCMDDAAKVSLAAADPTGPRDRRR